MLRCGSRIFFVRPDEIDWIDGAGNYSRVHARGSDFLVREMIGSLEQRLSAAGFLRLQRSVLVNVDRVAEIRGQGRKTAVVLVDGTELPMSNGRRRELEELLSA